MNSKKRFLINSEILILTALVAFCSIIYELLLSNTLAIVTGNYVWWQSLTIGIYIGGLGLGAFLSDKIKNTFKSLMYVELGLSFFGAISVAVIYFAHGAFKYVSTLFFYTGGFYSAYYLQNEFMLKVLFFVVVQLLTLGIGLLSGFEIPIMMKVAKEKHGISEEEGEHQILGFNYIGTLIGTICFAYFLLPKLDVIKTSVVVSLLNFVICIYILLRYLKIKSMGYFALLAVIISAIGFVGYNEKLITQRYLKIIYYLPKIYAKNSADAEDFFSNVDHMPKVERMKSLYQYLDIFTYSGYEDSVFGKATILTLDTKFQFDTTTEKFYHQGFVHGSIAMNKKIPKKILVLGAGDGMLIRELIRYPEVEYIKHIELDAKMIDLANSRFAEFNLNSLKDPRVHTEINDGFYYVRNTHDKYDAIFIDFPYPNSYDLAKLYSVEFYTYIRNTLSPNGFVILDIPFFQKESYDKRTTQGRVVFSQVFNDHHLFNNTMVASTFHYAGFKTMVPFIVSDESFVFLKAEANQGDSNFMDHADLSKIDKTVINEMKDIGSQKLPYKIMEKHVNSIFRPVLTNLNDY